MIPFREMYAAFKASMRNAQAVVGMNRRNLSYVYPSNPRKYFDYANDKLLTKKTLEANGLSVPKTFLVVSYFYELQKLEASLRKHSSFVIKPSCGSGGNGIVVISDYREGVWISVGGTEYTYGAIKKHIADIIFGVYSFGLNDSAIIEERIIQNEKISQLSPYGLADIRMINYKGSNIKAMLRIATMASDGRANLHQGGIGVAVDLASGNTFTAQMSGEDISHHPDTDVPLLDVGVPYWSQLLRLCEEISEVIPMGYLGIDIAMSEDGPIILEVNARPGIEIQNISHEGMRESLSAVDAGGNL